MSIWNEVLEDRLPDFEESQQSHAAIELGARALNSLANINPYKQPVRREYATKSKGQQDEVC